MLAAVSFRYFLGAGWLVGLLLISGGRAAMAQTQPALAAPTALATVTRPLYPTLRPLFVQSGLLPGRQLATSSEWC